MAGGGFGSTLGNDEDEQMLQDIIGELGGAVMDGN